MSLLMFSDGLISMKFNLQVTYSKPITSQLCTVLSAIAMSCNFDW